MFGTNPIRGIEKGDGSSLFVHEIFATMQGEGPFVGYPAVFLRLSGCNLACTFCDTEFENMNNLTMDEIIEQIQSLSKNEQGDWIRKLVVITGGEPLRQPIEKICDHLINLGFAVQIETNGTLYRKLNPEVHIICSPKNTDKGYHAIRDDLLANVTALKFIVSYNNKCYNYVPEVGQQKYNVPTYIQPMDEYDQLKNQQNLQFVKSLALKYGYRVSLQLHKIIEVD